MKFSKKSYGALMITAVFILLIIPFMDRPWLNYMWQFPNEGGQFVLHTNILNYGDEDWDDVEISVMILDLGIFARSNQFDLDDHSAVGKTFYIYKPRNAKGEYLTQVSIISDKGRTLDTKYIYLDAEYEAGCCN